MVSRTASVSYARTPLEEVSEKAREIVELGWQESGRRDPWAASHKKDLPETARDPESELGHAALDRAATVTARSGVG